MPVYKFCPFLKKVGIQALPRVGDQKPCFESICCVAELAKADFAKAASHGADCAGAAAMQACKAHSKSNMCWEVLCFVRHTVTP